jgi:hypothetical protein
LPNASKQTLFVPQLLPKPTQIISMAKSVSQLSPGSKNEH